MTAVVHRSDVEHSKGRANTQALIGALGSPSQRPESMLGATLSTWLPQPGTRLSEVGCPEADKLLRNALYGPEPEALQDKSALRHVEDVILNSNSKQQGAGRGPYGTGAMQW